MYIVQGCKLSADSIRQELEQLCKQEDENYLSFSARLHHLVRLLRLSLIMAPESLILQAAHKESTVSQMIEGSMSQYLVLESLVLGSPLQRSDLIIVRHSVFWALQRASDPFVQYFLPRREDDMTPETEIFELLARCELHRVPPPPPPPYSRMVGRPQTIAAVSTQNPAFSAAPSFPSWLSVQSSPSTTSVLPASSSSSTFRPNSRPAREFGPRAPQASSSQAFHTPRPFRDRSFPSRSRLGRDSSFRSRSRPRPYSSRSEASDFVRDPPSSSSFNGSRHVTFASEESPRATSTDRIQPPRLDTPLGCIQFAQQQGWSRKLHFFRQAIHSLHLDGATADDNADACLRLALRAPNGSPAHSMLANFLKSVRGAASHLRNGPYLVSPYASSSDPPSASGPAPASSRLAASSATTPRVIHTIRTTQEPESEDIPTLPSSDLPEDTFIIHMISLARASPVPSSASPRAMQALPVRPVHLLSDLDIMATQVTVRLMDHHSSTSAPVLSSQAWPATLVLDSGAEASVISESFYRYLGSPPAAPSSSYLRGIVGRATAKALGDLILAVELDNGHEFLCPFHIYPGDSSFSIILGFPQLRVLAPAFGLSVLFGSHPASPVHTVSATPSLTVSTVMASSAPSSSATLGSTSPLLPLYPAQSLTIKPRSLAFVQVSAPTFPAELLPSHTSSLCVPSAIFPLPSFGPLVSTSSSPQITYLPIVNISTQSYRLTPAKSIGTLHNIADNPVVAVHDFSSVFDATSDSDLPDSAYFLLDLLPPTPVSSSDQEISDQVREKLSHLPPQQQQHMHAVLMKHITVLRETSAPAHVPPVPLPTRHDQPLHSAPYKLAPPMQKVLKDLLAPMLRDGIIKPSISQITSPVVLVKKKDSIHTTPTSLLFEHLGMDFVGSLPPSLHRNRFILALTDYFSKWAEAYPLPDQSANYVAVCLADWITRYGAPIRITSDRGASFVSEAVASFCRLWGVQQQFASAYHPQANGLVERFNATLVDMLRAFSIESGKLWDEYINACLFAYRTSIHSSTNTSPDMLVYGQALRIPLDIELNHILHQEHRSPTDSSFVFTHALALERAREQARQYMDRYKQKYEAAYNSKLRPRSFDIGDLVWAKTESHDDKLTPLWRGPFRVFAKPSENSYLLQDESGSSLPSPLPIHELKPARLDSSLPESSSTDSISDSDSESPFSSLSFSFPPPFRASSQKASMSSPYSPTSSISPLLFSQPLPPSTPVRPFPTSSSSSVSSSTSSSSTTSPSGEFEVEKILDERRRRKRLQYLVQWRGFPLPTWEYAENLTHCRERLREFHTLRQNPLFSPQYQRTRAPFVRAIPVSHPEPPRLTSLSSSASTPSRFITPYWTSSVATFPTSSPSLSSSSAAPVVAFSTPRLSQFPVSSAVSPSSASSSSITVSAVSSQLPDSFPSFPLHAASPAPASSTVELSSSTLSTASSPHTLPTTTASVSLTSAVPAVASSSISYTDIPPSRMTRSQGHAPTSTLPTTASNRELKHLFAGPRADQARSSSTIVPDA